MTRSRRVKLGCRVRRLGCNYPTSWRSVWAGTVQDVRRKPGPRVKIRRAVVNGRLVPGGVCWAIGNCFISTRLLFMRTSSQVSNTAEAIMRLGYDFSCWTAIDLGEFDRSIARRGMEPTPTHVRGRGHANRRNKDNCRREHSRVPHRMLDPSSPVSYPSICVHEQARARRRKSGGGTSTGRIGFLASRAA